VYRKHVVTYLSLGLIWGSSFVVLRDVVAAFGWAASVSFRALLTAGVLYAIARIQKKKLNFGRTRDLVVVGSTTVALQLSGLGIGTPRIGTALCAIFVAAIPLYTMVIGQLWGIEHITRLGRFGVLVGMVGMVLLVGFPSVPIDTDFIVGCIAMLIGTIAAAFGSNYTHKHQSHMGSMERTIGAFFFGGLLTLPLVIAFPVPTTPRPIDYVGLLALATIFSGLAYVLYFALIKAVGPTVAISSEFLVTLVAVLIGAGFLGEALSALQIVGGVVIIASCTLVLDLIPRSRRGSVG
jgi:drug/metabolite transporter (DMT)-like permease